MSVTSTQLGRITNEFPCLMRNHLGTVILFSARGKGTVLDTGDNKDLSVGYHATSWDTSPYFPLKGAIKLENE